MRPRRAGAAHMLRSPPAVGGLGDTSIPRDSSITRSPTRISSWSSANHGGHGSAVWQREWAATTKPPRLCAQRRAAPPKTRHPFAHPDEATAGRTTAWTPPGRGVLQVEVDSCRVAPNRHEHPTTRGVLERVGQPLLDDAEDGQVNTRWQPLRSPWICSSTSRPLARNTSTNRWQVSRRRPRVELPTHLLPEKMQQPTRLVQGRRPARWISSRARSAAAESVLSTPRGSPSLADPAAQGMGDHVVPLPGEPPTLVGHRALGELALLPQELVSPASVQHARRDVRGQRPAAQTPTGRAVSARTHSTRQVSRQPRTPWAPCIPRSITADCRTGTDRGGRQSGPREKQDTYRIMASGEHELGLPARRAADQPGAAGSRRPDRQTGQVASPAQQHRRRPRSWPHRRHGGVHLGLQCLATPASASAAGKGTAPRSSRSRAGPSSDPRYAAGTDEESIPGLTWSGPRADAVLLPGP